MYRLFLLIFIVVLSLDKCFAQDNINIKLKDYDNNKIPFYTVQNLKETSKIYIADSLGNAFVPKIVGLSYSIRAIGYRDTIITIKEDDINLSFIFKSYNLLKEVTISHIVYSKNIITEKAHQGRTSDLTPYNTFSISHDIARIITFEKKIWLKRVAFKAKYGAPLPEDGLSINVFKVTDKMQADLDKVKLKYKQTGWCYFYVSAPDMVFSGIREKFKPYFSNGFITFDMEDFNIQLEPGTYLISMERQIGKTPGLRVDFSLEREVKGLGSYSTAKKVAWSTESVFGKLFSNPITEISYSEKIN